MAIKLQKIKDIKEQFELGQKVGQCWRRGHFFMDILYEEFHAEGFHRYCIHCGIVEGTNSWNPYKWRFYIC